MAESDQHDPNTQYLLFKIALRCRDTDLGKLLYQGLNIALGLRPYFGLEQAAT